MKKILSILAAFCTTTMLSAQDFEHLFDSFQQSAQKEMQAFQDETRKAFFKALEENWKQFNAHEAIQRPPRPKPQDAPVVVDDVDVEPIDIPLPVIEADSVEITLPDFKPLDIPDVAVSPISRPENKPIELEGDTFSFSFYGVPIKMVEWKKDKCHLAGNKEKQVASFWRTLEANVAEEILPRLNEYRERYDLNDWTLYRFVSSMVASKWSDASERVVVEVFILNHMGIDARIGRVEDHLSLLFPAKQMVYARPFITLGSTKYFIMDPGEVKSVLTYNAPYSKDARPLDLELAHADYILDTGESRVVRKEMPSLGQTISLPVQQTRCEFYLEYPQVPVIQYAHARVNEPVRKALLQQLSEIRNIPDKRTAVSSLMRCIQKDFDYATDQDQFGFEKPFFVEENFVYACNDCEDRSILLAFLVKNLLNLDVVLLDYPEHIATAVNFGDLEVPGAYVTFNNKKYTVCDPTYIGAGIGMVMPQYRNVPATVLY